MLLLPLFRIRAIFFMIQMSRSNTQLPCSLWAAAAAVAISQTVDWNPKRQASRRCVPSPTPLNAKLILHLVTWCPVPGQAIRGKLYLLIRANEFLLHRNSLAPHGLDLVDQGASAVQLRDIITAADTLAVDHDIGHGASSGHLFQLVLELLADRMLVEFYDERWRVDGVLLEK